MTAPTPRTVLRRAVRRAVRALSAADQDLPLAHWRLTRDEAGQLLLDGAPLARALETFGSPLHLVDATRLIDNARRFTAKPADAPFGCEVFYSYKTNPVPGVLKLLHQHGIGAEAASPYELWLAHRLGVPGRSIVFDCPAKPEESVKDALELNIALLNLNCRAEIDVVAQTARALKKRARVGLRVAVPQGISGQFGERIDDGSAFEAFKEALARPELEVVALHAHLNGEVSTEAELDAFLDALLTFSDQLRDRLGLKLEIFDLGGNLASPTVTKHTALSQRLSLALGRPPPARAPESVLSIDSYVARSLEKIGAHHRRLSLPAPRVFLEPGRAMTSNAQMLLCRVIQARPADGSGVSHAMLDAGLDFADGLKSEQHQWFALTEKPGTPRGTVRLTGPSCTLGDLMAPAAQLPELKRGDALAIMDAGAYFVPYSKPFSFPRPAIAVREGGNDRLLRRRETFEHLVALDEQ